MFSKRVTKSNLTSSDWSSVIAVIDDGLDNLRQKLEVAFSEGSKDPQGKEYIKLDFFRHVWRSLERDINEFGSLQDLEQFYHDAYDDLGDKRIKEYLLRLKDSYNKDKKIKDYLDSLNTTKDPSQASPISDNKLNLLRDVINLYYALMRTRYLLRDLELCLKPATCNDDVEGFAAQCANTKALVKEVDLPFKTENIVKPLMRANQQIINALHNRGYGDIEVANMRKTDEPAVNLKFMPFIDSFRNLPGTEIMNPVITVQAANAEEKSAKVAKIKGFIRDIETFRLGLAEFGSKLFDGYEAYLKALRLHCDSLKAVIHKINSSNKLSNVFQSIIKLNDAQRYRKEDEDSDKFGLSLVNAALNLNESCRQQSNGEIFTFGVINRGWGDAGSSATDMASEIIQVSNQVKAQYTPAFRSYTKSIRDINEDIASLNDVDDFIADLTEVLSQTKVIFAGADTMLSSMAGRLGSMIETTLQYLARFAKDHWWKMALVASVLTGGGFALAFTVFAGGAAATVALPAGGFVVGNAVGAGIGVARDHIKGKDKEVPPLNMKQLPEVDASSEQVFDTKAIFDRIFASPFAKSALKDMGSTAYVDDSYEAQHRDSIHNLTQVNIDWSSSDTKVDDSLLTAELFPKEEMKGGAVTMRVSGKGF